MSDLTIGDLTAEHLGRPVYGLDGIQGWESHLLLDSIESKGAEVRLNFRWNDDPSPSNTKRGQYAVGVIRPPATPCSLTPTPPTDAAEAAGGGDRG